jgi:hypothetical protein
MGLKTIGAILVGTAVALAALPADAATTTKRKPTRVTVTKRSYLNPGTEVKPGEGYRGALDYMAPPGFSPYSYYDQSNQYRYPLPDPFWLPGSGGPYGY